MPVAALAALALLLAPGAAAAGGMSFPPPATGVPGAQAGVPGGFVSETGDEAGVRVVLDSVSPVVLRPGRAATLSGRVVNDSPSAARLSDVTLSASTSMLGSRREVADWVEGGIDRSTSWVLGDDTVGPLVPAGDEVRFSVTVPGATLDQLPDGPAALAVRITAGVDGDAAPSAGGDGAGQVAELRTVLTSSDGEAVDEPLQTSWVVPLTVPPDPELVNPDPAVHAAAWLNTVGPDSAARTWLEHFDVPDVTWLIDPALLVAPRPEESVSSATPEDPEGEEEDEQGEDGQDGQDEDGQDEGEDGQGGDGRDQSSQNPGGQGEGEDDGSPTGGPTGTAPAPTTTTGDTTGPGDDDASTTGPVPVPPPDDGPTTEPDPSDEEPSDEEGVDEGRDGVPGDEEVGIALDELRGLIAGIPEDGRWWLPTGDPDLARLASDDAPPQDRVAELLTRSPAGPAEPDAVTRLLETGRSDVLWPALAGPTSDDLARILSLFTDSPAGDSSASESSADGSSAGEGSAEAGPTAPSPAVVVVPRESFTASSAAGPRRGAVPVNDVDAVALGPDSWTTALVAGSAAEATEDGVAATTQHLLAHTLGTWLESPTAARELVIAPPRGTSPPPEVLDQLSRGWKDAGWLTSLPAEEVLDRAEQGDPVSLSGTPPQEVIIGERASLLVPGDSPVDDTRGTYLVRLADELDGLAEILTDTDALRSWTPALSGLWSTRWREDPEAWPVTFRTLNADVDQARESVHIAASTVNFIADQGTVHITVVNDMPIAVEDVRLRVTTDNGRLQILRQPDPVSVGPGSRASVPFDARAITRGEVTLSVELSTPGGTDLGVDEEIAVRVQPTGVWIYWVLGGLAGVILVLGLARALRGGAPRVAIAASTGSAETTASPTGSTETTASPTGSTETTASPTGSTETAAPTGSTGTGASPGSTHADEAPEASGSAYPDPGPTTDASEEGRQ